MSAAQQPVPRARRRTPIAVQLWSVLALGAVGLSLIVALVVTDGQRRDAADDVRRGVRRAARALAQRAAPLLDRQDDLRLAVLAASVADVSGARVLLLDRRGVVQLDTGLSEGGVQHPILTADGSVERVLAGDDGETGWEMVAPALANTGFVGEVRLRVRHDPAASVSFAWDVFGVALLCALSLVLLAWWIVHHWLIDLRSATTQVRALGEGEPRAQLAAAGMKRRALATRGGAIGDMLDAVDEAWGAVDDQRRRGREGGLDLARRLVLSLEQRGLAPTGHGERTRRYAQQLAEASAVPAERWEDLGRAAGLIDLGRAAVRASALTKNDDGDLTATERESLRHAPGRAAGFLNALPDCDVVAAAIRHHREKYDGTGYPDGLRAERIPLESRILAIAEAYDLLTSDPPHGNGLHWPEALDRMHDDRGVHFDPELLDLFEAEIRESPTPVPTSDPVLLARGAPVGQVAAMTSAYKRAEDPAPGSDSLIDGGFDPAEISVDDVVAQLGAEIEFEVLQDDVLGDGEVEGGSGGGRAGGGDAEVEQ